MPSFFGSTLTIHQSNHQLSYNRNTTMNLTELKAKPIAELLATAQDMGLENVSRSRKQDIIFVILKKACKEWGGYLR